LEAPMVGLGRVGELLRKWTRLVLKLVVRRLGWLYTQG